MTRPIVVFIADQLGAHILDEDPCAMPWLKQLCEDGRHYDQAYCSFPLCTPSRSSMMTGLQPHELGVMDNETTDVFVGREPDSLGHWFASQGFKTAYAGKWHAPTAGAEEGDGFEVIHPFGDHGLADAAIEWLQANQDETFLLVVSWDDPHTICEFARDQPQPYGNSEIPDVRDCPPLPANFYHPLPEALETHQRDHAAIYGTRNYTEDDWRRFRAVYRGLCAKTDEDFARVAQHIPEDAILVVLSDHGDGDGARRWNQKTVLLQECVRVPLVVSGKGIAPEKISTAVNSSTGLFGELCELAEIDTPREMINFGTDEPVVVESKFKAGGGNTQGRALIQDGFKYVVYSWGAEREALYYLPDDPFETRNLVKESQFDDQLMKSRRALFDWCRANDDNWMVRKLVWPPNTQDDFPVVFDPPY